MIYKPVVVQIDYMVLIAASSTDRNTSALKPCRWQTPSFAKATCPHLYDWVRIDICHLRSPGAHVFIQTEVLIRLITLQ